MSTVSPLLTCDQCEMRQSVLFADLTNADFHDIQPLIQNVTLAKGEALYQQDEQANALFTIREGLVKLEQYLEDGSYRIVSLLGAHDLIGLEASLTKTYEHTAVALLPTKVCRIPREVVTKICPRVTDQLMNKWHNMVRRSHQCALELSTGTARQRMARLLLLLLPADGTQCQLFARDDVGALLGITTETACRAISDFRKKKLIEEVSSNLFQCNVAGLQAISTGN